MDLFDITSMERSPGSLRVAVIGDVHGQWRREIDEAALQFLNIDMALFVGDFGEEDVSLVQTIARCPVPKAVVLGNHDAWNHGDHINPDKRLQWRDAKDTIQLQLAALGTQHVGWSSCPIPGKQASVVGGRPFSWGGPVIDRNSHLNGMFGVRTLGDSAAKILAAANQVPKDHELLLLAHSGPTGLGELRHDPCGCDFKPGEGDYGDADLRQALDGLVRSGRKVPLVAFGHMHELLMNRGRQGGGPVRRLRRRIHRDPWTGTVFLNAAVVPRVMVNEVKDHSTGKTVQVPVHHYCVVEVEGGSVSLAQDVFLQPLPPAHGSTGIKFKVASTRDLLEEVF